MGRSSACTFHLEAPDTSKEHASLHWTTAGWELRDLGSRNGTFVGEGRLEPGDRAVLAVGDQLRFGNTERWVVESVEAPLLTASSVSPGEGERVVTGTQILKLGRDDDLATVCQDALGRWVFEHGGDVAVVHSGARVTIGDDVWTLELPELALATAIPDEQAQTVARSRFVFEVSADEEHVRLEVVSPHRTFDLKARSHHYTALTLARARLEEQAQGVAAAECGWVYYQDLQRQLAASRNHINVSIYRLRRQLEGLGFLDAACVVERRLPTGQLRLGVSDVRIESSRAR